MLLSDKGTYKQVMTINNNKRINLLFKTHNIVLMCLIRKHKNANISSVSIFKLNSFFCIHEAFLGCVRRDTIHAMNTKTTNIVLGANNAIALASSMNDHSVALVAFNQRDIFVEVNLI